MCVCFNCAGADRRAASGVWRDTHTWAVRGTNPPPKVHVHIRDSEHGLDYEYLCIGHCRMNEACGLRVARLAGSGSAGTIESRYMIQDDSRCKSEEGRGVALVGGITAEKTKV